MARKLTRDGLPTGTRSAFLERTPEPEQPPRGLLEPCPDRACGGMIVIPRPASSEPRDITCDGIWPHTFSIRLLGVTAGDTESETLR
jgi:hypothetical protein